MKKNIYLILWSFLCIFIGLAIYHQFLVKEVVNVVNFADKDSTIAVQASKILADQHSIDSLSALVNKKTSSVIAVKRTLEDSLKAVAEERKENEQKLSNLNDLLVDLQVIKENLSKENADLKTKKEIVFSGEDSADYNFITKTDSISFTMINKQSFLLLKQQFINNYSFLNVKYSSLSHESILGNPWYLSWSTDDLKRGGLIGIAGLLIYFLVR